MEILFPRLRCLIAEEFVCERGSNLVEVVLTVSLIALAAVAGMERMANRVDHAFLHISENLASIFDNSNFGIGDPQGGAQSSGTAPAIGNVGGSASAGNHDGGGSDKNGISRAAGGPGGINGGGAAGGGSNGGGDNHYNGNCNQRDKKENCSSKSDSGGSNEN